MTLISMDKKYRRQGGTEPVRVLCVDRKGDNSVLYLDEELCMWAVYPAGNYISDRRSHQYDLVEYIEPKMVPLGPEDIEPGFKFRRKSWEKETWFSPLGCGSLTVSFCNDTKISYSSLESEYEINRNDGKGWVACEKPAQE